MCKGNTHFYVNLMDLGSILTNQVKIQNFL